MSASFDYYRTFYYVAKYKNFTRAATMLLSSQPSVTRSIQNLESELACTVEQSASEQPKLLSTACCWIGWRCSRRSIRMSKSASVTEPLLTCFPI